MKKPRRKGFFLLIERLTMSLGIKVALRDVLNEDVAEYIQQIAHSQRREMMRELHTEYFQKLAKVIENKIDAIEMDMEENTLSEYGIRDLNAEKKMWEWSYVLDDIFYKSGKMVNSRYRPDPEMM
mgnify:CR=1 FL=1